MKTAAVRFRRTRAFCAAFMLTICVVLFLSGLLLADINTRAVAFGEGTLTYAVTGGDQMRAAVSGAEGETAAWIPARVRALWWILSAERTVASWLIQF